MNYKSMLLITLLLPAFCYSQNNEEPVSDLEERVSTVDAKTSKQVLKIVSLEEKDNVTPRKTIKPTPLTPRTKYLCGLFGGMIGWYLTECAFNFVGFECNSTFPEFFCCFTIAHNLIA